MITSAANPRLKLIRKLESRRQRAKLGLFVCEGEDLVDAALAAGIEPHDLLVAGEDVEPELLAGVSTLAHPPRVIGVFRRGDLPPCEQRPAIARALARRRPGNVGTLIRTADAFGASVALSEGCADPTGPKALRASAGAIFRVPLGRFDEAGGTAGGARRRTRASRSTRSSSERERSFVLGAEREGLPDDVVAACDAVASIPIAEASRVAERRRRRRDRALRMETPPMIEDGMRLEGIHHITCITADAPRNVEFYAGMLGLRLVKKTVNQDDPTVYHLFYADENGSPGSDITFFEYPGARRGQAGRGDGPPRHLAGRLGGGARLLGAAARRDGVAAERGAGSLLFHDPEGLELELAMVETDDEPLAAKHPDIPAELALQGFDSVRAYTDDPERSRDFLERALGFRPESRRSRSRAATSAARATSTT